MGDVFAERILRRRQLPNDFDPASNNWSEVEKGTTVTGDLEREGQGDHA